MAVVYVMLIVRDEMDFNKVPVKVQPKVKDILISMDLPELAE